MGLTLIEQTVIAVIKMAAIQQACGMPKMGPISIKFLKIIIKCKM